MTTIDFDYLHTITDGDVTLEKELFGLFFSTAERCFGVMLASLQDKTIEGWKLSAHELKGAASGLGIFGFSELCREAEHLQADQFAQKEEIYQKLADCFSEVRKQLEQKYG
jgi:HPt (histidine-containing phosphotransfer) domain-containing protein